MVAHWKRHGSTLTTTTWTLVCIEHIHLHSQSPIVKQFFTFIFLRKKKMSSHNFSQKKRKTTGCPLCVLSAGIQCRVPVSIYIQMSPSIFPGAGEGCTLSTVMRLTNLASPSGRQACDAQWESEKELNAICLWCLSPFLFYAPRCNLCIQPRISRLCFHFTEIWKRSPACRSCNYYGGLMIGLFLCWGNY